MNPEETAATDVLMAYQAGMNHGDLEKVLAQYAPDAVLMAPGTSAAVGAEAIRAAYSGMLQALRFDIAFRVVEVQLLSPEWAFARTSSEGTMVTRASNSSSPEGNQELFLLHKPGSDWKIARYCFNVVLPS